MSATNVNLFVGMNYIRQNVERTDEIKRTCSTEENQCQCLGSLQCINLVHFAYYQRSLLGYSIDIQFFLSLYSGVHNGLLS